MRQVIKSLLENMYCRTWILNKSPFQEVFCIMHIYIQGVFGEFLFFVVGTFETLKIWERWKSRKNVKLISLISKPAKLLKLHRYRNIEGKMHPNFSCFGTCLEFSKLHFRSAFFKKMHSLTNAHSICTSKMHLGTIILMSQNDASTINAVQTAQMHPAKIFNW